MLASVLLMQIPPADPRPVSSVDYPIAHRTPDYRLSSVLPAVSIALPDRSSALAPAVSEFLKLEDPARKVIVSRGSTTRMTYGSSTSGCCSPGRQGTSCRGPTRTASTASTLSDCVTWCATRGGGVEIYTHSDTLAREMAQTCGASDFKVRLR